MMNRIFLPRLKLDVFLQLTVSKNAASIGSITRCLFCYHSYRRIHNHPMSPLGLNFGHKSSLTSVHAQFGAIISTRGKKDKIQDKLVNFEENDIEKQFVRGSGPGGQATNKTSNCVILKHLPTGIVVKCHQTRSQTKNEEIARRILREKLDIHYKGEESVIIQEKRKEDKKRHEKKRKSKIKLEKLKAFKASLEKDNS